MTLTAMLLAGGRSWRMGRDKATLVFDGEPLWQRQLQELRKLTPTALWVSARTRPLWCPPELEIVLDEPPSRGPLSGLAAGLSRLQTSHLLVMAIDLPRVPVGHLRKLWSLAEPGKAVIPLNEDYFEPLCAVYPAEAAPLAEKALKTSDSSLQHLAREMFHKSRAQSYVLTPEERLLYLNLNRPSDLAAIGPGNAG
jgi:molybdopterin-guanine dinucleotide biosynthesis protein A